MQRQYVFFLQLLLFGNLVQKIVGFCVTNSLVDVAKRFPLDGKAVLDYHLGFRFGQTVPLDGVARVGKSNAIIFPK